MNRLIILFAWLLILGAVPLVQAEKAIAASDATSHRSFATLSKTSVVAFTQPADGFSVAEWVVSNDDNSSGSDQPNACGISAQSYFGFWRWPVFSATSGRYFNQLAGSGQLTPLFVLFHAWKILPRQ